MEMDIHPPSQPDQLTLLPESEGRELLLPEVEQRKRFTGEQVARNRERYEGIVAALGEGVGVRAICRAFRCSPHTVRTIEEREPRLVATLRDRTARRFQRASSVVLESFMEDLERGTVPPATKWIAAATFQDKAILLSGGATSRHEVVSQGPQEALADRFAALKQARVVEIGAGEASPDSESGDNGGETR